MEMDWKSKIFFIIFIVLLFFSIGASYYRLILQKDFEVITQELKP